MTDRITVGVDGSPESRAALAWAGREAVRRGLPLRVVYAWQWPHHEMLRGGDRGDQAGWARDMVQDAVRTVEDRHPDLPVTAEVLDGAAVDSLLTEAGTAGTLVLGSRGYGTIVGFLLGSVGQQVIAEAPCPVVLVRADDRAAAEAGVGRSSWASRAVRTTARQSFGSRSRPRRRVAPGCAPYERGACRRCSPTAPAR